MSTSTTLQYANHGEVKVLRSDEEALAVAQVLADEFAQEASLRDRERRLPVAELKKITQSGLWAITVPKEYGGAGVSYVTLAQIFAIFAKADGSIGQIPQNHYFVIELIREHGSEEQKKFFFERILAGDHFGNALVELNVKKPEDRKVSLFDDGDQHYRANVCKFYATGSLYADWIPTALNTEDKDEHHLAFFSRHAEGLTIIDDWAALGQRTTASGSVILDNARIEKKFVISHREKKEYVSPVGPTGQIMHAAIDTGIARAAFEAMIAFIRGRNPKKLDAAPDASWEEDQLTIREIGDLSVALHGSEALLERAGKIIDHAYETGLQADWVKASIAVSEVRAASTHAALLITNKLFEFSGTQSTASKHNLDRYWRDARTHTLHDPVRWRLFDVGNYYLNDKVPLRRRSNQIEEKAKEKSPEPVTDVGIVVTAHEALSSV
ncbi:MAG: SfnB family sulfur acquisition oxidoreductase [Pseudomonadota bacterium]